MKGADVFFGLSVKGAVTKEMVQSMADKPIIFAMANPDPEITPEDVARGARRRHHRHRPQRLRQPDQQRAGLPLHLPRRARRARPHHQRGDEGRRRRGAGQARARGRARRGRPRLFRPPAALRARIHRAGAVRSAPDLGGVVGGRPGGDGFRRRARSTIPDMAEYRRALSGRLDPTSHWLQSLFEQVKANPQRIVFAEGEEERTIRAAVVFRDNGYGTPILIGREEQVRETMKSLGIGDDDGPRDPQCAALDAQHALHRPWSTSACSATATCAATCSAWSTRAATCSAPAWWRWATPTAW